MSKIPILAWFLSAFFLVDANPPIGAAEAVALKPDLEASIAQELAGAPPFDQLDKIWRSPAEQAKPEFKMLMAANAGNLAAVRQAVAAGADLYYCDQFDLNVLAYAVLKNRVEIVTWLLGEGGFDPKRVDQRNGHLIQAGTSGLAAAAWIGDTPLVTRLLSLGVVANPGPDFTIRVLQYPALTAAIRDHQEILALLIRQGASLDCGSEGLTVIHYLIAKKDLPNLKVVIERRGVKANGIDKQDRLLTEAVEAGWLGGVAYLLSQGASPYDRNGAGDDSFALAKDSQMKAALVRGFALRTSDDSPASLAGIELLVAIALNDRAAFERALAVPGAIRFKDPAGRNALIHSIMNGPQWSEELIKAGSEINSPDQLGASPLGWACQYGRQTVVAELLRRGVDVESYRPPAGWAPLTVAAENGYEEIVQQLLVHGAKVDPGPRGSGAFYKTALMGAAQHNQPRIVEKLLAAGADPNARDSAGMPVLFYSMWSDNPAIIKRLVAAHADLHVTDQGMNAAGRAMMDSKLKSLTCLADLGLVDESAATAILGHKRASKEMLAYLEAHYARLPQEVKFWADLHTLAEVQDHLDQGGDPNFQGFLNPLQRYVFTGKFEIAALLLEKGADPNRRGTEPFDLPINLCWSPRFGHTEAEVNELVKSLLAHGADPNVHGVESLGSTPLITALQLGMLKVAETLLQAKADPDLAGELGTTAWEALGNCEKLTPAERQGFRPELEAAQARLKMEKAQKKIPASF